MKRKMLFVMVVLSLIVSACATPAPVVEPTASGPTKYAFWHSMGGSNGEAIGEMMKRFNASQTACIGEAVFQGSYDDSLNKLKAGLQSKDIPAVVQQFDLATQVLVDLKVIAPMQEFIDAEKFNISDYETNVLAYYTVDGKLYGMPFNTSNPMLYYNKDMFTAAGLDPNKPPTTWDELVTAAKALTKDTNGDGKPDQWGFNTHTDTHWYFSAMIMQNGGKILSDDGKKVIYNSPEGIEALQFWGDLVTKHKVMPPNQHAQAGADFTTGKLGMIMRSSSFLATVEKDAKFKVGVAILPGKKVKSVPIGGASLLVFKTTAERQKAAWEFVQWMTNAENSLSLFTQTNYVPIRKSVASMPAVKDYIAKSPNSEVLIKQLEFASAIPIFAELGNSDEQLRKAVEKVELGSGTAKDALDVAASVINKALGGP